MSNLDRLITISEEISETVKKLQSLDSDRMCAKMAEKNYNFELSIINKKEDDLSFKLNILFSELQAVYKSIKGV